MLKSLLAHPMTKGMDLDDPNTTSLRKQIIKQKPFLKKIYDKWYSDIIEAIGSENSNILELGSGGGYLHESLPSLITSDIIPCSGVKVVMDGRHLPFSDNCLGGIVMTNVLHHIPDVRMFFNEAARCVKTSGVMALIEPWTTPWSRFVYGKLHHEPFDPGATSWKFPSTGPLSGANGALPWIIFQRDRNRFEKEYPCWKITKIEPCMPFCYLVSGGISMRNLMPGWTFSIWQALESCPKNIMDKMAMFSFITLVKIDL